MKLIDRIIYKDTAGQTQLFRRRRICIKGAVFAAVLLALPSPHANAVPLGHLTTTTGVVEFNIDNVKMFGNGAAPVLVGPPAYVGGPCGTSGGAFSFYACKFTDNFNSPNTPYAWETAIQNPVGQGNLTAKIGFFYPFGGPLLGTVTLAPGSTLHVGIIVNDALIGEVGNRGIWYSWKKPGQNILTSAAVIEGAHAVPFIGPGDGIANTHGEYWYHFHSDPMDSFVVDPTLDANNLDYAFMDPSQASLASSIVPVPAAAWLFGSGLIALFGSARRRHKN
ncbi:MAG: VPLPA-CTERM sorting domain-containing protein [Gammaproteobacteria bacterium]